MKTRLNAGEDAARTLIHCWWERKTGCPFQKTDGRFLIKLNISLLCMRAKWPQLCLTLCNPMDCSWPGSSVHAIL